MEHNDSEIPLNTMENTVNITEHPHLDLKNPLIIMEHPDVFHNIMVLQGQTLSEIPLIDL